MATYALEQVEIFGQGVLKSEGVVVDKEGNVYGGGRNGVIYKVTPDGAVRELVQLPAGSMPNGITMDRQGNFVYCDLGKKAMMRATPSGQVSMIADRVGTLALTLPNFASYDANGDVVFTNSSTRDVKAVQKNSPSLNLTALWSASVQMARATSWRLASTWRTARPSIPKKRQCTCWKAPGMTVCASRSRKTERLVNLRFTRRTFLRCRTAWPLTWRATSTSPCLG